MKDNLKEIVYELSDGNYLQIKECKTGWEYEFYTPDNFILPFNKGVVCKPELTIREVYDELQAGKSPVKEMSCHDWKQFGVLMDIFFDMDYKLIKIGEDYHLVKDLYDEAWFDFKWVTKITNIQNFLEYMKESGKANDMYFEKVRYTANRYLAESDLEDSEFNFNENWDPSTCLRFMDKYPDYRKTVEYYYNIVDLFANYNNGIDIREFYHKNFYRDLCGEEYLAFKLEKGGYVVVFADANGWYFTLYDNECNKTARGRIEDSMDLSANEAAERYLEINGRDDKVSRLFTLEDFKTLKKEFKNKKENGDYER